MYVSRDWVFITQPDFAWIAVARFEEGGVVGGGGALRWKGLRCWRKKGWGCILSGS